MLRKVTCCQILNQTENER